MTMGRNTGRAAALVAMTAAGCASAPATLPAGPGHDGAGSAAVRPGYTVRVDRADRRGTWEGFGTSLSWWAKVVGGSPFADLYADLFFTRGTVSFAGRSVPGLGLEVVRYNVGGGGDRADVPGTPENVPAQLAWYKDIEGYWKDWNSADPSSPSWDFSRDAEQRAMLEKARDRGVRAIELFATSPMWWMMDSKSAAGGQLQPWNRGDFAHYMAAVARYATDHWGVDVAAVEPFNEPSAGWWTYPNQQQGCNLAPDSQAEVLGYLRGELDGAGLASTPIAASDENSMVDALRTVQALGATAPKGAGGNGSALDLIGKINVHSYDGQAPFRDNDARTALHGAIGGKRAWSSEYGDDDGSGMALAETITEDLNFLRPTAWVYWQALEETSPWGLVNGAYGADPTAKERGTPSRVNTKYYVMAQFSRFLRRGFGVVGTNDHNTVAAYYATSRTIVFVTVNYGNPQTIAYDLSDLGDVAGAKVTFTTTDGAHLLETSKATTVRSVVSIDAAPNAVYSVEVSGVAL